MSPQLENALIESLDLLEQGTPIVKILARYPDHAEELRPYLITAVDLTQLAKPSTVAEQQRSKDGFLRQAAALQAERIPTSRSSWLQRALTIGLAALLFLLVSSSVLAFASSEAIPGDTLYGTKLILEQMQLTYSANPETAAAMIERFHRERIEEVAALLALNRHEQVSFSGTVEELSADRWLVEGIPVAILPTTEVPDGITTGFLVQITGTTGDGVVTAERVEVVRSHLPEPEQNDPAPPEQLPTATPAPASDPVAAPPSPILTQPTDGAEPNPPADASTRTVQDDSPEIPGTGDSSPGEDGGHDESEAGDDNRDHQDDSSDQQDNNDESDDNSHQEDDNGDRSDDNSDQQDDNGDQSDDSSDQNESEEGSGSNSGSGGDDRESEDDSQEEKQEEDKSGNSEEDKHDSGNDEEDKEDNSGEQSEEEESDDSSSDTGDDAKEEDSGDGNSGKGSDDESEDEEKRD